MKKTSKPSARKVLGSRITIDLHGTRSCMRITPPASREKHQSGLILEVDCHGELTGHVATWIPELTQGLEVAMLPSYSCKLLLKEILGPLDFKPTAIAPNVVAA